jgi:NAD(P)-dependent dehydrogenase (short-subunit alcohol dehydrogenase family)
VSRLAERVVLVTGSTGIAAATARQASAEGASLFVVSRTADHARGLADSLDGAAWAAADLAVEAEVDAAVGAAVERFGRIDGLFSAVGGSGRRFGDGPVDTLTADAWEATVALNLRPHVLTCARVLREMRRQEPNDSGTRGSIVLLGSVLATSPVPANFGTHAYAAAKGGLAALAIAMAAAYVPDRIRVNTVAPSLTDTPMAARAAGDPRILEYTARKQPLAGAMLDPREVAMAVVYFLADESRAVTGQTLAVDGGWSVVSTGTEAPQ